MLILRDCMSTPVIAVDSKSTILDAAKVMAEKNIESLLVEENGNYIGIFTTKDLIKRVIAKGLDYKTHPITEVISYPILTVDFCLTPAEANDKMIKYNVKRLAVTEGKKIVGIISMKDLVSL